jgi:CRISPR system Cascade subunit CasE
MYLSRLVPNPLSRDVQQDLADCQKLHQTIMAAFPQTKSSPRQTFGVLYRLETSERPHILVQSRVVPDWGQLPPGYCLEDPMVKSLQSQYERLRDGMVLRFRLTANPTKKIDTKTGPDGKRKNGRRVVLRKEDEQIAWLVRKGETGGFELLSLATRPEIANVAVLPMAGSRRGIHSQGRLTFGGVVFEGQLRITDAQCFRDALASGIGSGKSYGFGLLSIAP